ncbi:MAG: YlxM family DNA-binding protein [Eubacterium sp.]|nr:YlxM family DNA-binding protein [Eubacterium sp.]
MAKNLEVPLLLDFYGEMLTDKQRDFLELYYNEDLSLSEIAENEGITRQGVRDSIKRAESQLFDMEGKLHLFERFNELVKGLDEIKRCADAIYEYNLDHSLSREINENAARIKSLAEYLSED